MNYDQLMAYEIIGNAYSDQQFLNDAIDFIMNDSNPIDQRAAVIRKYDSCVGYEPGYHSDDKLTVQYFINDINQFA